MDGASPTRCAIPIVIGLLVIIVLLLGGGPIFAVLLAVPFAGLALLFSSAAFWMILLVSAGIGCLAFLANWGGGPEARTRRKAEQQERDRASKQQREKILSASDRIEENLYRHPDRSFVAIGPRSGIRIYRTERGARSFLAKSGVRASRKVATYGRV